MAEPTPIVKPWIIVHEPRGKTETILAGPPDADERMFGIVIADVIRHVARAYGVSEDAVIEWVAKEIGKPSTALTGQWVKFHG